MYIFVYLIYNIYVHISYVIFMYIYLYIIKLAKPKLNEWREARELKPSEANQLFPASGVQRP